MTDLEITKACAEAMGVDVVGDGPQSEPPDCWLYQTAVGEWDEYDPLHDDAQAMALVKKFPMVIESETLTEGGLWCVESVQIINGICPCVYDKDLNRAICECVAKLHNAKLKETV